MEAKLIKNRDSYYLTINKGTCQEVIAHSFDGGKQILSLKNCQAIERGYDLERTADMFGSNVKGTVDYKIGASHGFEKGFQYALEILDDKKIKNMLELCDVVYQFAMEAENNFLGTETRKELIDKVIQQTEWDVEVVQMLQVRHGNEWYDLPNQQCGNDPEGIYQRIPRLDGDGCLILKRI